MKILFFSHYFYPEGNAPASRVYEMAKVWVKEGHEVTVITCAPNVPNGIVYEGYKNKFRHNEEIDGIKVVRIWTFLAANKGTIRRILNFLSYMIMAVFAGLFSRKPDVVIATSPQFFCGWAGVIVSKLRRVPFVLEIRDLWPDSIVAVGVRLGSFTIRALEKLEDWMYKAAGKIVTVGKGYKKKLIEKGVCEDKIEVIMNGLNSKLFTPIPKDEGLAKKWQLQDKFVCMYSGTIGMACGLNVVVEAAEKLLRMGEEDIAFLLVGDGAEREKLQQVVEVKGLSNIIFTGRQPKTMMPAFLSISDVSLVHLKKTDLFCTVIPSKIFESAGMECPILVGVPGCATELVEECGGGISFEPENSDGLIEGLLKLKEEPEFAIKLGKSGRKYMLENFERGSLAKNYLKLISESL